MLARSWTKDSRAGPLINHKAPMKYNGLLDKFESFDLTPVIGREYVDINLADLLEAPNSDELLRDLAITG